MAVIHSDSLEHGRTFNISPVMVIYWDKVLEVHGLGIER